MAKTKKRKIIPDKKKRGWSEVVGILLIILAILIFISLVTYSKTDLIEGSNIKNRIGLLGAYISEGLFYVFGYVAYLIPISLIFLGVLKVRRGDNSLILEKFTGIVAIILSSCAFLGLLSLSNSGQQVSLATAWGGSIGIFLAGISVKVFGVIGSYIIVIALVLISAVLYTNLSIAVVFDLIGKLSIFTKDKMKEFMEERRRKKEEKQKEREKEDLKLHEEIIEEPGEDEVIEEDIIPDDIEKIDDEPGEIEVPEEGEPLIPPISILKKSGYQKDGDVTREEIILKAKRLKKILEDYGIGVEGCSLGSIGPRTTRYDVKIKSGEKVSKIENIERELALAFHVEKVRVSMESGVRGAISVDIPNDTESLIFLGDILSTQEFREAGGNLPIAMGIAQDGGIIIDDLTTMPHLLIGGSTGSGKSVFLNSIINSLVFQFTYQELKLILIDLKRVEFGLYFGKKKYLPHLLFEVLTDEDDVQKALNWLVVEMEERYQLLAQKGSRNIVGYNNKIGDDELHPLDGNHPVYSSATSSKLPYLVVVIDELGDLMTVMGRRAEEPLTRLAQMARAVGIHLIIATQRPSVDVITGLIKANFPTRISFQVSSKTDSRTILDKNGAESLLGNGDYLYLPVGVAEPKRIQAPFVSTEEINTVMEYLSNTDTDRPDVISSEEFDRELEDEIDDEFDELYFEAMKIVVEEGKASISQLQRKLRVGHARAGRIIDQLERSGVIGPDEGPKARDVYLNPEDLPDDFDETD
jgi:S-DNA-T family DNA segregation ATPase FtsK/SpoIIIE